MLATELVMILLIFWHRMCLFFYPCSYNMPKAKLKINELISLVEISRHSNVDSVMWLLIIILYRFTIKKESKVKEIKKLYTLWKKAD